jgi:hypothetical protein
MLIATSQANDARVFDTYEAAELSAVAYEADWGTEADVARSRGAYVVRVMDEDGSHWGWLI